MAELQGLIDKTIEALDEVLVERPEKVYQEIDDATRCLVMVRNCLISQKRKGVAVEGTLAKVNSLMSMLVGGEYPLVGVRKERVVAVREGLRGVNAEF